MLWHGVTLAPSAPRNVSAEPLNTTAVLVQWILPEHFVEVINEYTVCLTHYAGRDVTDCYTKNKLYNNQMNLVYNKVQYIRTNRSIYFFALLITACT